MSKGRIELLAEKPLGVFPVENIMQLYRDSIIINGLDISNFTPDYIVKLRASGITASNATVTALHDCRDTMDLMAEWLERFSTDNNILPVLATADIHRAKEEGKAGIILGFQNATPIDDNADLLRVYHRLGVRIIQLTYMTRNLLGDGCLEISGCGLSSFGEDVVREMNRLGILVDCSHVGLRTTLDACAVTSKPIALTHANPKAVHDHPRNKEDEELKAVAATGGVIGVNAFPSFVGAGSPTIEDVLNHLDYMVDIVGIDHVGVGADFIHGQPIEFFMTKKGDLGIGRKFPPGVTPPSWPWVFPKGIESCTEFPNIALGMAQRGYSEDDITKVMGLNFMRLFGETWTG